MAYQSCTSTRGMLLQDTSRLLPAYLGASPWRQQTGWGSAETLESALLVHFSSPAPTRWNPGLNRGVPSDKVRLQ